MGQYNPSVPPQREQTFVLDATTSGNQTTAFDSSLDDVSLFTVESVDPGSPIGNAEIQFEVSINGSQWAEVATQFTTGGKIVLEGTGRAPLARFGMRNGGMPNSEARIRYVGRTLY